ncbi:hypothetical protein ACWD25_48195 [Streptomyces sp. NPDC002920]
MIAYVFLGVSGTGVALVIAAVRWGHSAADLARHLVEGSGTRRITARQARHQLRLTRHELAGAGEYIGRLERDRRELSAGLERLTGERGELRAALEKATLRIADLEETARRADRVRELNTALKAQLANLTAIRPLSVMPACAPPATPTPSAVAVPLHTAPFAHSPAAEPS